MHLTSIEQTQPCRIRSITPTHASSRWTLAQSGCLYTLSHSPLPGNSIEYTSSSPSVTYVAGSLLFAKSWCSELFLWLPLSLTLTLF